MEKNKARLQYITRAALFTALLVVCQLLTRGFTTLVTGSLVNLILVLAAMLGGTALRGYAVGVTVALVSPVLAKLLGIGPLWSIIPFIMLGNLVLVLVWRLMAHNPALVRVSPHLARAAAAVVAALAKFAVLNLGVVVFMLPLLGLPQAQAAVVSATFSLPQLFTALIGGGLGVALLAPLSKALANGNA